MTRIPWIESLNERFNIRLHFELNHPQNIAKGGGDSFDDLKHISVSFHNRVTFFSIKHFDIVTEVY